MPESNIRRLAAALAAAFVLMIFPFSPVVGASEPDPARIDPDASGVITLARSLELALAANPELAVAARELEASEGALVQGRARPNPTASYLQEDTRAVTRTTTVQVEQPIELGGKRKSRIAAAERGRDIAAAELSVRRAEIKASVTAAFYEVLAAQEGVRLAEDGVVLATRADDIADAKVRAGKVAPVEEINAQVALASARIELMRARGELAAARQQLAAAWGDPSPRFERAEGALDVLPKVPSREALEARLEASPHLQRAGLEIERRRALAALEQARRWPDLTLGVGLKRDEQIEGDQTVFGLSMPLPIFDRNRGNRLEAAAREEKAKAERSALHNRLGAEVFAAREILAATLSQAETLRTDVLPGAQDAYRIAAQGFDLGKFGFLDVLVAQRTLFQARSLHLRALADAQRAATEIDRLLGDAAHAAPLPSFQE